MACLARPAGRQASPDAKQTAIHAVRATLVTSRTRSTWRITDRVIAIERPIVVGVLNVTPDSFSDGGRFVSVDAAVTHAATMVAEGADVIDVGGESTRPQGARPVDLAEELDRVLPVVAALRRSLPGIPLSVDTVKSEVAAAALEEGAHIINDVSGFRLDPQMERVCAAGRAGVVLMHSRGDVSEMATYAGATYRDVVDEVLY
jgi:dihydropteroate synthase